jgi:hypothetical protein
MRNRKWLVLGVLAVLFAGLFVAGFAATYVGARDDKQTCEKIAAPAGAVTVRVQRRQTETDQSNDVERLCVWIDGSGATVRVKTLP